MSASRSCPLVQPGNLHPAGLLGLETISIHFRKTLLVCVCVWPAGAGEGRPGRALPREDTAIGQLLCLEQLVRAEDGDAVVIFVLLLHPGSAGFAAGGAQTCCPSLDLGVPVHRPDDCKQVARCCHAVHRGHSVPEPCPSPPGAHQQPFGP